MRTHNLIIEEQLPSKVKLPVVIADLADYLLTEHSFDRAKLNFSKQKAKKRESFKKERLPICIKRALYSISEI